MTKPGKFFRLFSVLVLFLTSFSFPATALSETAKTKPADIAILPFEAHAAKDLGYLTSGIRDMLASRLASSGSITIVETSAVDQALAKAGKISLAEEFQKLGKKLGADYVVTGSLTAFGSSLSLDAKIYTVSGTTRPQSFYANAAKEDDIIMAVDQMAWNIGEQLFGTQRPATQMQTAPTAAALPQQPDYQTAHPARAFIGSQTGGAYGTAPLVRPMGIMSSGFTKSQNFRMGLRGMDVGDVDGDGIDEFVLASQNEVQIYRRDLNRFSKIGQASTPARYLIHSVTLADLDNNGKSEIYVSAADTEGPYSFALEWDGKDFGYLFQKERWYIRALEAPGEGLVLAGQKAEMDSPIAPGIYSLTRKGDTLQEVRKLPIPKGINLFDFSFADLDADGQHEIVAISQGDKLMVLQQSGKALWVSGEYYGGTTRYLGGTNYEDMSAYDEHHVPDVRIYVPARIIIRDINKDGLPDVIVNKNLSTASRILSKMRSYPSGEVHALTWNGIALTELWRTRKIDGYIADYQLGPEVTLPPADAKSKETSGAELYVGLVLRSGGLNILKGVDSTVLTYQLDFSAEEERK